MHNPSPLQPYLDGFRLHCVAENKSPRTVRWYEHKLRIFADYLETHYTIENITEIGAEHIRAFLVYLQEEVSADELNPFKPTQEKPLSPQTIQGYHRTIRTFFSWLKYEGVVETDPSQRVRRPKAPQTVVETFSDEQVKRLLAAPDKGRALGYRDYCILLLLLDTGIRLSELSGLTLPDLHLEAGYIQVRGKGDKERLVPIGKKVRRAIWRYRARFRPEPIWEDLPDLFLTRDGRPFRPRGIYQMIVRRGRQAGLRGVRCSPHTFRHTFAVNYLRNGGDVFSLQRILGHSSLIVTRMYVNLADSDIQMQHRKYGPVDRLGL